MNKTKEIIDLAKHGFLHLFCTVLKPRGREICVSEIRVMQEVGV